jgi:hypothetical protein
MLPEDEDQRGNDTAMNAVQSSSTPGTPKRRLQGKDRSGGKGGNNILKIKQLSVKLR